MESILSNTLVPLRRRIHLLMTSNRKVSEDEFLRIVLSTNPYGLLLHTLADLVTECWDLFVEIIRDEIGLNRVMRMLGISDDVNTILLYPIMSRFPEIMTHEHGKYLASRVLDVCNIHEKNMFYHTTYRHALFLARDENGCNILKNVITMADDLFKYDFLDLVAQHAHSLCMDDLGISLIQHVLNLEFTKKTTEKDTRLHELMAAFDDNFPTSSDTEDLHKLASKLTSDPDVFVEFVKTKRGSLMVQVILGKSQVIDILLWEAIMRRFTDVTAHFYGYHIMVRTKSLTRYHTLCLTKEPNTGNFLAPRTRRHLILLMTSCGESYKDEFLSMVSAPCELHKFANILTSYPDLFVQIIRDKVGLDRVMRILGVSDDINTILLYPVMSRFPEIMTHEHGKHLASRVLAVCNMHERNMLYHITYRHALSLASDKNGCNILKYVVTIADDDLFVYNFSNLIAEHAHSLCMDDLGISLIQHVVNLEFPPKTTEVDTHLYEIMAEFDETLRTAPSDTVELHKLASKLTSDPGLFVEFVKTTRGSLMVYLILGKSEEIDRVFWEAIKQRFTDVATDTYGYYIMGRTKDVFEKRGDSKVDNQLKRLIGYHALYLTTEPCKGNFLVKQAIDRHDLDCTEFIACGLQCSYIGLSFRHYGSNIVEMLLGDRTTELPLLSIVMEIVKCDEDTLVRMAKDEYGNGVLKKTLQVAKARTVGLFGDLVDKLKPVLDSLRGSRGENIALIIDSELEYETESDSE